MSGLLNNPTVITLLTAGAYFYFNWRYFVLVKLQKLMPRLRVWFVILSFFMNYSVFVLCSVLELHLIVNWLSFAALLFLETLFYNGRDCRCALYSAFVGIICSLTINIFCRSAISLLANEPLLRFDNHITSGESLKGLPIFLGFLLAGVTMHILSRPPSLKRTHLILSHPQHQSFLLEVMAGLLLYLFLNLLLYSVQLNDLLLKVWSIKSCFFCIIGFFIAVRYAWRICELTDYQEKNQTIERELQLRQREETQLLRQAARDALTGVYNRPYAEETLASLLARNIPFALCFIDLDGLKAVNDHFGHGEGDRYILMVADEIRHACRKDKDWLFRYGGDEFLAVFAGTPVEAAEQRAQTIQETLTARGSAQGLQYPVSISYGVAASADFHDMGELIQAADAKMYSQKLNRRKARGE